MYWNTSKIINNDTGRRLTLTWDVLKSGNTVIYSTGAGLTLTWDVLKW